MQQHETLVKQDIFAKNLNTLFISKHFVPIIVHLWMKYYLYDHCNSRFGILGFKNMIFDTKIITLCFTDEKIHLLYDFMAAILNF